MSEIIDIIKLIWQALSTQPTAFWLLSKMLINNSRILDHQTGFMQYIMLLI